MNTHAMILYRRLQPLFTGSPKFSFESLVQAPTYTSIHDNQQTLISNIAYSFRTRESRWDSQPIPYQLRSPMLFLNIINFYLHAPVHVFDKAAG